MWLVRDPLGFSSGIDLSSQSFGLGRPPGMSSIHVDCQLPLYEEDNRSPDGCKRPIQGMQAIALTIFRSSLEAQIRTRSLAHDRR